MSVALMCLSNEWALPPNLKVCSQRFVLAILALGMILFGPKWANAQRPQFGQTFQVQPGVTQQPLITQPPPASIQPNLIPQGNVVAPAFDPFRTQSNPFPAFSGQPAPGATVRQPQIFVPQGQPGQFFNQPQTFQPAPFFNNGVQNNQASWPNTNTAWPSQAWARLRTQVLPRLLERPRFRHTWLVGGDDANDLDINDTEIATTMTFANWLGSSQPVRVSPGFIFHFWDGPNTALTGFDLPAQAYSAYVAGDFASDPRRATGFETNLTVGVYSDFANTSSDAIRITGVGLGWVRLNSYTTFKLGVEYLDRVNVKLLPAFGIFMTPNSDLVINLYFPRPKVAHRLQRVGPFEVWAYAGAEYGGGSWAIERTPLMGANFDDQVDVNDVRAFLGLEWMGPKRVTGFAEVGYAFEREILYQSAPLAQLDLPDTFFLRTGLSF